MSEREPTVLEVRKIIESIEDEYYRHGFMYQFLIAGEVSEVFGEYAPSSSDAIKLAMDVDNKSEQAVLFLVKTARKKKISLEVVCFRSMRNMSHGQN